MNPGSSKARATRTAARDAAASTILDAAEHVIAARGIEATSIAAIAERAGVAVGTLYNYFPDRDSLLASLFRVRREQLVPRLAAALSSVAKLPFEQALRGYLTGVIAIFEERRAFVRVAVAVDQKALKIKERKPVVLSQLTDALVEILHGATSVDQAYARMIVGALKGLILWRIERDQPLSPADADLLADTFLKGLERV